MLARLICCQQQHVVEIHSQRDGCLSCFISCCQGAEVPRQGVQQVRNGGHGD